MKIAHIDASTTGINILVCVLCLGVHVGRGITRARMVVTDFSEPSSATAHAESQVDIPGLGGKVMSVELYTDLLQRLAIAYSDLTGEQFFQPGSNSSDTYFPLADRMCLVELKLFVTRATPDRLLALARGFTILSEATSADAISLFKNLSLLPHDFLTSVWLRLTKVTPEKFHPSLERGKSSEDHTPPRQVLIKSEHVEDTLFQESDSVSQNTDSREIDPSLSISTHNVEPSQRVSQGNASLSGPSLGENGGETSQTTHELDTQISSFSSYPKHVTLADLNRLGRTDRLFQTKAYVVGFCPTNLEHLCTKNYEFSPFHDKFVPADPVARPLDIYLTDLPPNTPETLLDPTNSLTVRVSADDLLSFFQVSSIESLYTHMGDLARQLHSRINTRLVDLQIYDANIDGIFRWYTHNLTIGQL